MACIEACGRGDMDTAVCLGGNLFGSNPDAKFASEALGKLNLIAYLSTSLNSGHAWGTAKETLVLPVLPRDEEPQATTQESMFSYVRLSDGGRARHQGPRSEVSVLAALGRGVLGDGGPVNWSDLESHQRIRALIADLIPGLEPMADIDRTRGEFYIRRPPPGHAAVSDRIRQSQVSRRRSCRRRRRRRERQLRLMTVRSEGQFNTVVYEEEDVYRGQERRDVILISPQDMRALGLTRDQRVTVRSSVGEMRGRLVRPFDVRPGNAVMYYPEANTLVPRDVDPRSKTPAFKSVLVEVVPE